jgi:TRAP-type C4-dicarboxylate transport system permease small subunit
MTTTNDSLGDSTPSPIIGETIANPALRRLVLGLAAIAGVALMAMMLLTAADVAGRYLFNSPVRGGYQMIRALVALLFFLGLPLVTFNEGHLTVGLFDGFFRGRIARVRAAMVTLVSSGAMMLLTRQLFLAGNDFRSHGEILDTIDVPIWPFVYFMALMAAFATLIMLALLVIHARSAVRGD